MKCREVELYLAEYATDRLGDDERRLVGSHLEICPGCRETLAGMSAFFEAADEALEAGESVETVEGAIWPGLAERIREMGLDRPRGFGRIAERQEGFISGVGGFIRSIPPKPALVGLAALFLIAIGIGYQSLRPLSPEEKVRLQQEAAAELEEIERQYLNVIDKYSNLVERNRDSMDPELYVMYEEKLEVLDQYIDECREAIEENEFNINAREYLFYAYREKAETLREMISGATT
ncbi:anti-sigma factor family protein [candidate division KSB1 bacterium]